MKFSYRWMAEMVPGLEATGAELQHWITMKTAECEHVEAVGWHFERVVAGRVLRIEPGSRGHNQTVIVEVGSGKQVQVVCGAPNVRVGMLAAWVSPATSLNGKMIGRVTIDGVESEGMLASAAELGINRDYSGLLELFDLEPGDRIPGLVPDWVLEIDNKSLTHRPDLWGHFGMAREVAAITAGALRDPVSGTGLPTDAPRFVVSVESPALCPRYSALVFENVTVGPSPPWLQARLESVGLNTINNIVDVTNYVLAELPQPMHAFDADKLSGSTIHVRAATAGESLNALNGERYDLTAADLVIADTSGPIALAGIIGGADTAISARTTRILLESANFEATGVRLTSSRLKLRTDASMRFEKSLDPENTTRGLARAIELFAEVCPGMRSDGGVADVATSPRTTKPILLPIRVVNQKLGKEVSGQRIQAILQSLGFGVKNGSPESFSVTVPSWRATKDIAHRDDLVEEVGRMIGYGEITPVAPLVACVVPPQNPMRGYLRRLRTELASQGFTETYNYSFVNQEDVKRFGLDVTDHLAVKNPIAAELTHLRRSLLPGIFKNIASNVRHYREFRLFEIGREIHLQAELGLPIERTKVVAVSYNAHGDERDFFELKRVLECVFPGCRTSSAKADPYQHPMRTGGVEWRGATIGRIFELHPSLFEQQGIEGRVMLFEVDLDLCLKLEASRVVQYKALRKFPTSGFDLSVVTPLSTPAGTIEDALVKHAGESLASIEFVRQYAGPPLVEGQKSVSYALEMGALDHTMTAEEVAGIRNRIIDGMRSMGFDLRV